MKNTILIILLIIPLALFGQKSPTWVNENQRNQNYPSDIYFTGFVSRFIEKSITEETQQAKTEAQADLSKKIRLQVSTKSQTSIEAINSNGKYNENESFLSQATTESNAEIVGMKTEVYVDQKANLIYAFAYVNKYELIGYYKSNLSVNVNQIESFVKTAQDLENNREKAKARQQLENAKPLFSKVRFAQDILTAIDANVSSNDLQQSKTESLYNQFTQMQAKLAQAVYVYVESNEDLFGKKVDIVASKVKAEFAVSGCSFTDNIEESDFKFRINVTTRQGNEEASGWADAEISLYDNHKQKEVYGDAFTEKVLAKPIEKAGRSAMEKIALKISEKLKNWIQ